MLLLVFSVVLSDPLPWVAGLGPGDNYLPMAHVLDVVGLVQHLAVQATDPAGTPLTQRSSHRPCSPRQKNTSCAITETSGQKMDTQYPVRTIQIRFRVRMCFCALRQRE